eukprot:TRINITY_DN12028_c0_g1_i1.p1 TRINITY_DN12028_c0_g1~~TRINITY_DN12028_c0_g1_i1.p1  ORF type:complete len:531 (-),score=103.67 TRINITY_DN12028_c0_g1_i1:150-1523(-)
MAATLTNVTGFAVLEGLASAMETLCGQAYGAEQHLQLGVILQRVQLILVICCLPIFALLFQTEGLLRLVGQDADIAHIAQQYATCLMPGLFGAAGFIPVSKFLQAQGVVKPLVAIAGIALAFHVLANWIIIYWFQWGFRGAALAFSATDFVELGLMWAYLKFFDKTGILARTWPGWSLTAAFQGWPNFFALGIPSAVMTCLEWWFFEIVILMSGWLPNPEASVGAMTICFQTAGVCYMVPLGLGTAVSVRVSNELGAGRPGCARQAVQVAVGVALAVGGALAVLLLLFRRQWALLFADDEAGAVVELVTQLMPSLVVSQLGIGLIAVLAGVLRGSGQQAWGSLINGAAFYALALPASAFLAFRPFKLGVEGLWWGLMLGVLVQILVIGLLTALTDWKHQAHRAASGVFGETMILPDLEASEREGPQDGEGEEQKRIQEVNEEERRGVNLAENSGSKT